MAHIWWDCPIIKEFWKEILQLIKEITNKEIPEDPWTCLFHGTAESAKQYKTSIVPILLNAAKSQIPKNWQIMERPKIRDWIFCVNEIYTCLWSDWRDASELGEGPDGGASVSRWRMIIGTRAGWEPVDVPVYDSRPSYSIGGDLGSWGGGLKHPCVVPSPALYSDSDRPGIPDACCSFPHSSLTSHYLPLVFSRYSTPCCLGLSEACTYTYEDTFAWVIAPEQI